MTVFFKTARLLGAAAVIGLGTSYAALAEKWDMPLAYSATNYHSENAAQFAKDVTDASGGKLEIVTHASGSLFKGGEMTTFIQFIPVDQIAIPFFRPAP